MRQPRGNLGCLYSLILPILACSLCVLIFLRFGVSRFYTLLFVITIWGVWASWESKQHRSF